MDPVKGNDAASGSKKAPWRSFEPLNRKTLKGGDEVIVSPGRLTASLAPKGNGGKGKPVTVKFLPGTYEWEAGNLVRRKLAISNTSDRPQEEKNVAMELAGVKHYRIQGKGAMFICKDRMVEIHLEQSSDVTFSGFSFDYERPTVSEFKAVKVGEKEAEFEIHPDSTYRIENGKLTWVGPGGWTLGGREGWVQTVAADGKSAKRGGPFLPQGKLEEIAPRRLRAPYEKNPGFREGETYWQLSYTRDYCGVFCDRSSRITFRNVKMHFMHGMGIVSQFSRDLTFRGLIVEPRPGRTVAAWADILHFSGCYGQITVEDCLLSAANDDAINVHGTHLRLVGKTDDRHIRVRFMHRQTFGFEAFRPGDEVQFTSVDSLRPCAEELGRITAATLSADGKEMELTLENPLPAAAVVDRTALENVTATPAVTVRNTQIRRVTTRGFLLTTRRPILLENCYFDRTGMHALLMEDDTDGWYESGPVHQMTVKGCTFDHCAEPVINFNPHVPHHGGAVHLGPIDIQGNTFLMNKNAVLRVRSTSNVSFCGNKVKLPAGQKMDVIRVDSENIKVERNTEE